MPKFPKFEYNWRYVSIYGGVPSLFVKFSRRSKNIKFVNTSIFGKKNRKIWKTEKLREKNVESMDKKLSDKNDHERHDIFPPPRFACSVVAFDFPLLYIYSVYAVSVLSAR